MLHRQLLAASRLKPDIDASARYPIVLACVYARRRKVSPFISATNWYHLDEYRFANRSKPAAILLITITVYGECCDSMKI